MLLPLLIAKEQFSEITVTLLDFLHIWVQPHGLKKTFVPENLFSFFNFQIMPVSVVSGTFLGIETQPCLAIFTRFVHGTL